MGRLAISLYRLLLRQAKMLAEDATVIRRFDELAWVAKRGAPRFFTKDEPPVLEPFGVTQLSASWLRGEVRRRFREQNGDVDQALEAIKALDEQLYLRSRQRVQVTRDVLISAMTGHVGDNRTMDSYYDDDDPVKQYFSYRITITNLRYVHSPPNFFLPR
jgi:hypothetical protein